MEDIKQFLKAALEFQEFAAKRGYELMMALGCKWKMYTTPDSFEFEEDGIIMRFWENTQHDCPDSESICLKVEELVKDEMMWKIYIETTRISTNTKQAEREAQEKQKQLNHKRQQLEALKKELGD